MPVAPALESNFFALVAEAHFATMRTKRDPIARLVCKISLTRRVYALHLDVQRILDFLNVLDWLMQLPPAQEASYRAYLRELERRAKMPYVHSMVRESRQQARLEGRQEGRREGRQEGRQEGRREGLQEGLYEGQLKGRREMLKEMLFSRFGPLPEAVRLRLELASLEELSRWAGRALVAESLAEVTRP